MPATLDDVLRQVQTVSRKIDTLIMQMGIIMALQDDLTAATATLQEETQSLLDSNGKLTQILADLRQAVADHAPVDPAVLDAFEAALGQHQTSVDKIAALTSPPPAPPGPAT